MEDDKSFLGGAYEEAKEYTRKGAESAKDYVKRLLSRIDRNLDPGGTVLNKIKHRRTELSLGAALEAYLFVTDNPDTSVYVRTALGSLVPMLIDRLYKGRTWPWDFAFNAACLAISDKRTYSDGRPMTREEQEEIIRAVLLSDERYLTTVRDVTRHDVAYDVIDALIGGEKSALPRVYFQDIINFVNGVPVLPDMPEGIVKMFGGKHIDLFGLLINLYDVLRLTGKWDGMLEGPRPYIILGTTVAEAAYSPLPTLSMASGYEFKKIGDEILSRAESRRTA